MLRFEPPSISTDSLGLPSRSQEFIPLNWTNHCDTQIKFKDVQDRLTFETLIHVSKVFGFGYVVEAGEVLGAEVHSRNYKVLTEDGKTFLLRACLSYQSQQHLTAVLELIRELDELGVGVIPCITSPNGSSTVTVNEELWTAFPFFEAEHYLRGDPPEIYLAAREIGRLHTAFEVVGKKLMQPEITQHFIDNQGVIPPARLYLDEFIEILELVRSSRLHEPFKACIFETVPVIKDSISVRDGIFNEQSSDRELIQLTHNDLHPHNILVRGEEIVILDFDSVRFASLYADTGFAMHRLVRQGAYHQGIEELPQLKREFERGYHEGNPSVLLNPALLLAHTLDRALEKIRSVLLSCFQLGRSDWAFDIPKQVHCPGEILRILGCN